MIYSIIFDNIPICRDSFKTVNLNMVWRFYAEILSHFNTPHLRLLLMKTMKELLFEIYLSMKTGQDMLKTPWDDRVNIIKSLPYVGLCK